LGRVRDRLTLVVPFDVRVGGHDGADHTGLGLVGLVVGFGVCGRHLVVYSLSD